MAAAEPPLPAVGEHFNRAALWIAVAIGFTIPISTALDGLLGIAFVACWIAGGRFREKFAAIRSNKFALAVFAFFLLHVAGSTYSAGDPEDVAYALGKASTLLMTPMLIALAPGRRWLQLALRALLASLTITLALSFLIWLDLVPFAGIFKGTPADPVVFKLKITQSLLMAYGALVLAAWAREATRPMTRALLLATAALAAFNVLFLVWGRTGQIVLLALIFYLLVGSWKWRGLLAATIAGVAIGGVVFFAPSSSLHQRTLTTIGEIEDWRAGKPATVANMRLEAWTNSLRVALDRPLIGAGTGGFGAAYAEKVAGTGMKPLRHPENQYLLTLVQLGGVGLVALFALFGYQWRLASRLPARTDTVLARGLVITIAVGSLFNSLLLDHTEALFFAWLAGLLYAGLQPGSRHG